MKQDIITGIDLGSGTIRVAVGQVHPDGDLHIIGAVEGQSEGISKGVLISIEDTVSSISHCVERAERMIGMPIEHAYVGISGTQIITQDSRGVVAVSRADGEIKEQDIERAIETAQTTATPPNYDILHVLPRSFIVDNQPGIKDPLGMTGVRLEVDAQIILGLSNQIKTIEKALNRAGIAVDELVFSVLASAEAVLNKRQKELGVVLVNLGSTTTSIIVFEEGDILTAKVLPIGSRHITGDISIGLRINLDLAELIKTNYGTSIPESVGKNETINLKDLDDSIEGIVSRKHVAEIINARCIEIFQMVDKDLQTINRSAKLPAGVVLTGAGAKLDGAVETAKKVFKLPASIGYPQGFITGIDKVYDPEFSTSVGLVLWGKHSYKSIPREINNFKEIGKKLKELFKSFMP